MDQTVIAAPEAAPYQDPTSAERWTPTVPSREGFEWADETYDDRMLNWTKPQADSFGTWYDWDNESVNWLLTELANGFWDDCGDFHHGIALSSHLCRAALIANEDRNAPKLMRILTAMGEALDYVIAGSFDDDEAEAEGLKLARKVYNLITGHNQLAAEMAHWDSRPVETRIGLMLRAAINEAGELMEMRREIERREQQFDESRKLVTSKSNIY